MWGVGLDNNETMVQWYTFTVSLDGVVSGQHSLHQQEFLEILVGPMRMTKESYLFCGTTTKQGLRFYMAIPDQFKVAMHEFLKKHHATPWVGQYDEPEQVSLLVGAQEDAWRSWNTRKSMTQ